MIKVGSEEELCFQLANYMRVRHPNLIFHFDFGSGVKLTMGQAAKQRRLNQRAFPDLFIAKSTFFPGTINVCGGLFIELKKDGTRLRKRNGDWVNEHIAEQAEVLDRLADEGYIATFCVGFDEAVATIESYLRPVLKIRSAA